ncbi:M48 family metallopeptidase [Noviherbaspirillum massiliense]|uniref:M48 family metallopeptidase n=1 Tax=Noviherbaspirillum massiliense TaxID=1465823 RepID=UPI000308A022|nr:M48 family metallopeptidase [Noviherbaspirillum massiliense]
MIDAIYFDGISARRHPVTLMLHKGVAAFHGEEVRRSIKLSRLDISERLAHAPRLLRMPDGACLEVNDPGLDRLLRANGYRDPWVVRWQQNWPLSLFALVSLLAALIAGYQWGLPWAADNFAQHLPASIEKKIGEGQMTLIDERYMQASKLDPAEQVRLRRMFAKLQQPYGEKVDYRLEFRDSRIGPNAFALPNGVIVMTDQLVQLAQDDRAVMAVLGHELGHLHRRHSLRRLLQAAGVGVVMHMFIGDVSSALAALPTFLIDQKYSRDFEREADQYAIEMMQANEVPLSPMADLFVKMGEARSANRHASAEAGEDDADDEDEEEAPVNRRGSKQRNTWLDYMSSHPSDDERIARLKAADDGK